MKVMARAGWLAQVVLFGQNPKYSVEKSLPLSKLSSTEALIYSTEI